MQEERLIRTNPPCASTDLGGGPTTVSRTAGGCGEGGSGCVAGARDQLKGCRGHGSQRGSHSCAGVASGKP